jgi:tight adherence protein C
VSGLAALAAAAALLGAAAIREALADRSAGEGDSASTAPTSSTAPGLAGLARIGAVARLIARLGLEARLARAGLAGRVSVPSLLGAKLGGATVGALIGLIAAPAAPARLSLLVALGLPAAGFVAPDAWLEREARRRLRRLRARLPDALDRFAVGAAAGRSPAEEFAEVGRAEGPLERELAVARAEIDCGTPQHQALAALRSRVPITEIAAMCAVMERSRRHGSPLADQLAAQASAIRRDQRRRIEEGAAKAAPKIQLAVALLLVPSVLLMIAAALLSNMDRFLAGL